MKLFEVERIKRGPRRTSSEQIEPLPLDQCPDCGRAVRDTVHELAALFWLHGHGYTIRETIVSCTCGYRRHHTTEARRP